MPRGRDAAELDPVGGGEDQEVPRQGQGQRSQRAGMEEGLTVWRVLKKAGGVKRFQDRTKGKGEKEWTYIRGRG